MLVKFAVAQSRENATLFWGKSSTFAGCPEWPKEEDVVSVRGCIQQDAKAFFEQLRDINQGFYFLEADEGRDLEFLRGYDYRNRTARGLSLILAEPFQANQLFLQAKGRVCRGSDEGQVFTLPRKMWRD